jgi:hypothetical protein
LLTVPDVLTYAPPFTEYVPPVIEIGDAALIPDTVIVFDVTTVLSATPVWSVKVNWFGVVSVTAIVVTLKVSLTPPIVSVAFTVAE